MREAIQQKIRGVRDFYASGFTEPIEFRKEQLRRLKNSIQLHYDLIISALWSDLHKSPEEAFLTEISIVLKEIDLHISKLQKWTKPRKVLTPLHLLPSRSEVHYEPLGVVLIIAPFNYPFQLLINPLIGAISSGCTAVVKPSAEAKATAEIVEKIIYDALGSSHVEVVQGDREECSILLEQRWDHIFFTGSSSFGKVVYEAAAKNLTPVTLELGGKSPSIVDSDADIKVAAKRIAWGKWINCGQTCVAPDYIFVHNSVKDEFLASLVLSTEAMYGSDASKSGFYPRIVSKRAYERIINLLDGESIYYGGNFNKDELYISPTIISGASTDSKIMREEIFAPILPVFTYYNLEDVVEFVNSREKPLALYYFGGSGDTLLSKTSSGGACINDTIMHVASSNLPFGGVGSSGIGRYHGKESFMLFSNQRSVVTTPTWIDLPFRYPPFRYFRVIRRLLR